MSLGLRLVLELVLAIGLPVAAALVWDAFVAPKASRRLRLDSGCV